MTERAAHIDRFLSAAGWADAARAPLAGDASGRRYERLTKGRHRAVLMDAPGDPTSLAAFVTLALDLSDRGLSAPNILDEDRAHGLLLLEDFGDAVFAREMACDPAFVTPLYDAAVDVLCHLHSAPPPARLKPYGPENMAAFISPAFEFYQPDGKSDPALKSAVYAGLEAALRRLAPETEVMILRDYHAENLIWLPDRSGIKRVGLLDFQDALVGHHAYDLVSLLEDARRDVGAAITEAAIARYIAITGIDAQAFRAAYAVQGTQRNLRILGVFARLAAQRAAPHYVDLLPRVWQHLMRDLAHPALHDLRPLILQALPEPTQNHLNRLKAA